MKVTVNMDKSTILDKIVADTTCMRDFLTVCCKAKINVMDEFQGLQRTITFLDRNLY